MLLLWKRELVPDVYGGHLSGVEKVAKAKRFRVLTDGPVLMWTIGLFVSLVDSC